MHGAGLRVGRGVQRGSGLFLGEHGGTGAVAGVYPDDPDTRAGHQVQVNRTQVLDPCGRQGRHHVRGRGRWDPGVCSGSLGLVGAPLAQDTPIVDTEESDEGLGQRRMGIDGTPGRRHRILFADQVEEIAGDDQDSGAVPGVEGLGQLRGERQGRCGGIRCEQQVTHHHDPLTQGDVHTDATRLEGHLFHVGDDSQGFERARVFGVGCRAHFPTL